MRSYMQWEAFMLMARLILCRQGFHQGLGVSSYRYLMRPNDNFVYRGDMQSLNSFYKPLCPVVLPAFKGRQKYMHTFDLSNPVMAEGYEDYLDVVTILCRKAGASKGLAHMTVDEKIVEKGQTQRRPGPHVDGCFIPSKQAWGHTGGGWNHYCNNTGEEIGRMPIIVASNIARCKCWTGVFEGEPKNDGDLSHLELPEGEILPSNYGFLLSPDCIHESLPMNETVERTFLRIALPNDFKLTTTTEGYE